MTKNKFINKNRSLINLASFYIDYKKTTPLKNVGKMKYGCVKGYIVKNL